jgi:hypothetical protein
MEEKGISMTVDRIPARTVGPQKERVKNTVEANDQL